MRVSSLLHEVLFLNSMNIKLSSPKSGFAPECRLYYLCCLTYQFPGIALPSWPAHFCVCIFKLTTALYKIFKDLDFKSSKSAEAQVRKQHRNRRCDTLLWNVWFYSHRVTLHFREREKKNRLFGVLFLMSGILKMLECMTKSKISQLFACVISKQLILLCFVIFASFHKILLKVLPEKKKKASV